MSILLVEDEEGLAAYIRQGLSDHGHKVEHVARGDEGYDAARGSQYDLLIVDRMLPGLDGLNLVKNLRRGSLRTPVLFLSNLGGLDDRVEGLNAGADDYLAKPFAFSELLARVNALLRRPARFAHEPQIFRLGDLEMDRIKRKVTRGGAPILLQPREFSLLEYLLKHAGQVVTRTMLLEGVWNYHFDPKTHIVETHMSRLRSKLGGELIQTIRGSGYMIRAPKPDPQFCQL
jgi:two-component system, OmpR family, response regulator